MQQNGVLRLKKNMHCQLIFDEEAKKPNWERTVPLTSGAGKTG